MKTRVIRACITAAAILAFACFVPAAEGAREFIIKGKIESVGKDGAITLLFRERPSEKNYFIVDGETVFGTVEIVSLVYDRTGGLRHRAVARYGLSNRIYARQIRAGEDLALLAPARGEESESLDMVPVKERGYRSSVVTPRDGRTMLLVPGGKFVFGSGEGDRDETPEQAVYLDDYYIDKHEVSNQDYRAFVESSNARPPVSWKGETYPDGEKDLPVLVTYQEAAAYAKWAGKRLPTEEEWEKAARGSGAADAENKGVNLVYPWGRSFSPERANCAEFWADDRTGEHIKMRYGVATQGPLPVASFDPEGASPCGAVNMAGNAREWTSSWYLPYQGNGLKQGKEYKRYGTQYKVVRGGAWYDPRYRVRTTSRDIGGAPSLRAGNLAGFRCVRDPVSTDHEK